MAGREIHDPRLVEAVAKSERYLRESGQCDHFTDAVWAEYRVRLTAYGEHLTRYKRFGKIPLWLIDRGISAYGLAIYAVIATKYANRDGQAWPSREALAADAGVSVRSASRALSELIKAGAVTRFRQRQGGVWGHNVYTLVTPQDALMAELAEAGIDATAGAES